MAWRGFVEGAAEVLCAWRGFVEQAPMRRVWWAAISNNRSVGHRQGECDSVGRDSNGCDSCNSCRCCSFGHSGTLGNRHSKHRRD